MINQGIPWYYQEPFMPARPQDLVLWVNSSSWDGTTWRNLAPSYSNVNQGTLKNGGGDLIHPSGVFGAGLKFDGVDDYINCGNDPSLNITDAITIEAWVYCNENYRAPIIEGSGINLVGAASNSKLEFKFGDTLTSDNVLPENQWIHIVATADASNLTMYWDGSQVKQISRTTNPLFTNLYIGHATRWDGVYFNGTIGEVAIYNRALSAGEIFHNYTHTPLYYLEHGIDPLQLIQQTPQEVATKVC